MTTDALRDDAERSSDRRRAWMLGGSLLLASTVVGFAVQAWAFTIPGSGYIGDVLYAVSLLLFAFGIRGRGSVTARRPLGTTALALLALWSFAEALVFTFVPIDPSNTVPTMILGTVFSLVRGAVALIAVVQIGRAGAIPSPWNWAPAWVFAAIAVSTTVQYLVVAGGIDSQQVLLAVTGLDQIVRAGGSVFLGVLAVVLATRPAPARTVSIIDSTR